MPALGAALAPWAATAVSIASSGIKEFRELAQKKTPFSSTVLLRERRGAQYKLGRAQALYASARSLLYQSIAESWERTLANQTATLEQKADLLMAAVNAVSSASEVLNLLYSAAGTTAVYEENPIERHFRDIQVLTQHGFMSDDRYETVGQVYLGLEPDLSLVAF
jgi:alkylation response protein AidB-like acyl-CoA dehydrogenase